MRVPNDAQLMERLRADATGEALRELYRAYAGELLGFALNALGERGAAEEIVQEVFTRAWRHADRYDPARGSVRTWLYQITRHAIIDMRRRASARPSLAGGGLGLALGGHPFLAQALLFLLTAGHDP